MHADSWMYELSISDLNEKISYAFQQSPSSLTFHSLCVMICVTSHHGWWCFSFSFYIQLIVLYLGDTPKIIMMTLYLFNTYLLSTTNDDNNTATIIVVHIDQLPYGEYNAGNCGHLDWSQYPQRIEKSPLPKICENTSHFIYCPGNPDCDGVYLSEVEIRNTWN